MKKKEDNVPVCMVLNHLPSYRTETNMVLLHYRLDVFEELAALDGCFINNECAHKYRVIVCLSSPLCHYD